jgi:hypothetical protein
LAKKKKEAVNHPDHYNKHPMECIEVLKLLLTPEEFKGFCLGNSIKYRWRAGDKDNAVEDLEKAEWYEKVMFGELPTKD